MKFIDPRQLYRSSRGPALLLLAFSLAACAQIEAPGLVFDDGPAPADPAVIGDRDPIRALTGARPIRRADPRASGSANLAAVPPRPEVFSSPIERQALLERLKQDRDTGLQAGDQLRAQADGPQPPAVDIPTVPETPPPVPAPLPRRDD